MSSRPLIVLMALSSLLVLPGAVSATLPPLQDDSVADLLLKDYVLQAEALLDKQLRTAETVALRGEIEFRKGNFDKADGLYKDALKVDSGNARAHFGLGKLAMGKVKGKLAIEELMRAVELDPKEPLYRLYASEAWGIEKNYLEQRKHLEEYLRLNPQDEDRLTEAKAGLEMLKAFGNEEVAEVDAPQNPAPIRFRKSLNLIFASVKINGKGPYDFAIDTGATQTVLSEKLATELGLQPIVSTVVFGIGGAGKVETKLYKVKEFTLGDVKVRNLPVGTFNDPLISQLADGILGTSVLSDFIMTVNYPANLLELSRKRPAETVSGEVLPVWFFSNLLLLPLDVNGKRGNFIVDTGAVTTVLSHSMAAQLGVNENTPGAKIELGIAGVGGFEGLVLKIPNVTFKTPKNTEVFPQVVSIDLKQISKMIGTEVAGVVGYDFFSDYKLTLDYFAAEVRLAK
jgi:predicted aspartyl protease/Tfp pilus assembly protein PilF